MNVAHFPRQEWSWNLELETLPIPLAMGVQLNHPDWLFRPSMNLSLTLLSDLQ